MTDSIYNNAGMPSEQGAAPEIRRFHEQCTMDFDTGRVDMNIIIAADGEYVLYDDHIERIAALTLERDTLKAENEELNKVGTEVWTDNLIAEVAALKAKVERLSAPVSDAEFTQAMRKCVLQNVGWHGVATQVIAARASTPPAHPINDDEQRRKDAAWNDRPKARCVCGEMIAWYSGEWLHVAGRSGLCADGRLASPAHFLVGMPPAEPEWQKGA